MIYFQAHRGGEEEVPENTMAAFCHAWSIEGAIPEVDVRTTRDSAMICLHDATLGRTTDAPESIRDVDVSGLTLAEIRRWDAGVGFDAKFAGEKVPTFEECLEEMEKEAGRQLYVDFKHVDPDALETLIRERDIEERVILVHARQDELTRFTRVFPRVRTMTWISGTPEDIARKFAALAASDFAGITQVQVHLQAQQTRPEIRYILEGGVLEDALGALANAGAELHVRPFAFDRRSLRRLVDLGIRGFVTDAPARFAACLRQARMRRC